MPFKQWVGSSNLPILTIFRSKRNNRHPVHEDGEAETFPTVVIDQAMKNKLGYDWELW